MVLTRLTAFMALWLAAFALSVSPAAAHKRERHDPAAAAQQGAAPGAAAASGAPMAGHDMNDMMEKMDADRVEMSTFPIETPVESS